MTAPGFARARRYSGGLIEVAVDAMLIDAVGLHPADQSIRPLTRMISVDLRYVARDPAPAAVVETVRAFAHEDMSARDFVRPGRVFPIRVAAGGILAHPTCAEAAAVDLVRLAGLKPAAVMAEASDKGSECPAISPEEVLRNRMARDGRGEMSGWVDMPTPKGTFRTRAVHVRYFFEDALVLAAGRVHELDSDVPIYVHFECLLGDIFESALCDCRSELARALRDVATKHVGLVLYIKRFDMANARWPPKATGRTRRYVMPDEHYAPLSTAAERAALQGVVDGIAADFRVRRPRFIWRRCPAQ